ncbi:MAG: phosphoenolpyruvate--protein phosphotransferase [Candidatus Omnitrophica bacterium]|nr:phosphoenolpyruvate--protein phosphotransferase [Candidatus Omnitrophota bacterium]
MNRGDDAKLICDIAELTALFSDAQSLETLFERTVKMIAQHMHSEVCSIYLFSDAEQELILKANTGLNPDLIGKVRMKLGEGLTGLALKDFTPVCERQASKNPNFKFFVGLGEELFESFLAVPIARGRVRIGVLVVQNKQSHYFTERDITVLKAISSQLGNTIEMVRLIMAVDEPEAQSQALEQKPELKFVKGKVGSKGFGYAPVFVLDVKQSLWDRYRTYFDKVYTREDVLTAVKTTEDQLRHMQKQVEVALFDVASLIFSAQILMLKDQVFINAITERVKQGAPAVRAIIDVLNDYVKKFEAVPNAYLREKSRDVIDIGRRFLNNLVGVDKKENDFHDRIVVADELYPSDILKLYSQKVQGVVVLHGGETAHVSILAQSLQIPLIIADVRDLLRLNRDDRILLDAEQGNIYVNPSEEVVGNFKAKMRLEDELKTVKNLLVDQVSTSDGIQIHLMANINLLGEVPRALEFKAEGVGLYRTEFPFIVRSDFPSEEEQYVIYRKLVEQMQGKEITFRTLDIGGDKVLSYFDDHQKEKNPYLGLRSIRFSLRHKDIFNQQIRAILRAGVNGNVRIMFPMVGSLDEFMDAKQLVLDGIHSFKAAHIPHNAAPRIGMMVEIPSVISIIDDFVKVADFLSIGTNDFIQYMLAVDRSNEKVADLYIPYHPAVLRGFQTIVVAAQKQHKDVSVCGDMAHDPRFVPFFIGIGVRKLSINPNNMYKIQQAVKNVSLKGAELFAQEVLALSRIDDLAKKFGERIA